MEQENQDANTSNENPDDCSMEDDKPKILENSNLHLLPCRIHQSGLTEVSAYFDSLIKPDEKYTQSEYFQTSFRGKVFHGKKINVTVSKLRLQEGKEGKVLRKVEEFGSFYKWKFDEKVLETENVVDIENILEDLRVLA